MNAMISKTGPFYPDTKMAELITRCHKIVLLLPRFGINLGFGDKNVQTICIEHGIDVALFLMVCNVYADPDYIPQWNIKKEQMNQLLGYLIASHQYYTDERIPHIENHLFHLADHCKDSYALILKKFWNVYKNEMVNHFQYEEKTVYPYVTELISGQDKMGFQISDFGKHHNNIQDKLDDLTNIIIKYLPGDTLPHHRMSILFDLFQLAADIRRHTFIENDILIPSVKIIEGNCL